MASSRSLPQTGCGRDPDKSDREPLRAAVTVDGVEVGTFEHGLIYVEDGIVSVR